MTKRISPLESSHEIKLARKISSNSETIEIYTFFEASRFGCRKTNFDVTKVTYNMYSCVISGMSRELIKWTAEVVPNDKTGKRRDKMVIFKFDLSHKKTKL